MDKQQFAQGLAFYGARIDAWPEELRIEARAMLQTLEGQQLMREAEALEEALLMYRPVEPAQADLATRIVRVVQALEKAPKPSFASSMRAAFEFLLPNPALVLASVLALGCVIGLSTSSNSVAGSSFETLLSGDTTGEIL